MNKSPIPSSHPFQSAYHLRKLFLISEGKLKTAALRGEVRCEVFENAAMPVLYNVNDVKKYLARVVRKPRARQLLAKPPRAAAASAGN